MEKPFNSETYCPYDRDFCPAKEQRLQKYVSLVACLRDQGENHRIQVNKDIFDDCPQDNKQKCIRYQRYLAMIEASQKDYGR